MKRKVIFGLLMSAATTFFVFGILLNSIGLSVLQPGFGQRYTASLLFPEGWGFFTRNPRTERIQMYRVAEKKIGEEISFKSASRLNLFGFSRKSRRIYMEIARINAQVPDTAWKTFFDARPAICLPRDIGLYFVREGDYLLKKSWPVPWAWTDKKEYYPDYTQFVTISVRE